MEVLMRSYLALAILPGCAIAGAVLYSPVAAADWHTPDIYRESHDEWTNVHYDDGICEYRYSYNAEDRNLDLERWGDCSHVVVGPNGEPLPATTVRVYRAPQVYRRY
jgi:hypothetical protein